MIMETQTVRIDLKDITDDLGKVDTDFLDKLFDMGFRILLSDSGK